MTHIGSALDAVGGALQPALGEPEEVTIEVDQSAVNKALLVLRQLKAAGMKTPFDFSMEDASLLWATQISQFSGGILNDAVQEWIADPEESS